MKQLILNNFGWKLLSLCLAFIVWIVIVNIDDPVITKTISGVSVTVLNEDAIQEKDKVYEVLEGNTVSVYVKGKRSVVDSLSASDITATADLSGLSEWNAVPIIVSCEKYDEKELEMSLTGKVQTLKIALENRVEKQFQVTVVTEGEIAEGYYLYKSEAKPNLIEISGGESLVNKVEEIRVELKLGGASENITKKLVPKAYDKNGKVIDSDKLIFSTEEVKVKTTIWETKSVPVTVKTTGDPAYGYELLGVDYEPKTILLAGTAESLAEVSSFPVEVNITGAATDKEFQILLEDVWASTMPENVKLASEVEGIAVKAIVGKKATKRFSFSVTDVKLRDLAEGLECVFHNGIELPSVTLMGSEEKLNSLNLSEYEIYVDLKDYKKGSYVITFKIDGLPEDILLTDASSMSIDLVKQEAEEPEPSPEPGEEGSEEPEDPSSSEVPE